MHGPLAATILALLAPAPADGPDHLLPVDRHASRASRDYHRRVRRLLHVPGWAEAVVVRRPAFEPEEGLAIHRAKDDPGRLVMTYTKASRNLWYANLGRVRARRIVAVSRRDVPLPADLARRVGRLWNRMLIGVRPPADNGLFGGGVLGAMDDTVYVFERHGMAGQISYTTTGEGTGRLVALADALFAYSDAGLARRAEALNGVERACRALEEDLARRPAPVRSP